MSKDFPEKNKAVFTIGEFSRITGLPIETIRFYHEKNLLLPSSVDSSTSYRYYDQANIEKARAIKYLRSLDISVDDIRNILESYNDQADILDYFE